MMIKYVSKDIICAKMMNCNFRSPDMTVLDFINDELPAADVRPVSAIKELQEHIKQRILETAFNNGGIYGEVAEDIANRIDIWVDELRRNKNA